MNPTLFFLLSTILILSSVEAFRSKNATGKFLSVFNIVRFPNDYCRAANGLDGTCYKREECRRRNGTASGTCAVGFGVCCVIQKTCGQVSFENNTYLVSPASYSSSGLSTGSSCSYQVRPSRPNICQYRVDFLEGTLGSPINGECGGETDRVLFVAGGLGMPAFGLPSLGICGILAEQHFYLDAGDLNMPLEIMIALGTPGMGQHQQQQFHMPEYIQRQWNIKVTQITCDSPMMAPKGCLQYYRQPQGFISSFNYKIERPNQQIQEFQGRTYMNNLDYTACVELHQGHCSIRWEALSTNFDFPGSGGSCSDFVLIPNARDGRPQLNSGPIQTQDRFCGQTLEVTGSSSGLGGITSVLSYSKPFEVRVVTDSDFNQNGRGFRMGYIQQTC